MTFRSSGRIVAVQAIPNKPGISVYNHIHAVEGLWDLMASSGNAHLDYVGDADSSGVETAVFSLVTNDEGDDMGHSSGKGKEPETLPDYTLTVRHVGGEIVAQAVTTPEIGVSTLVLAGSPLDSAEPVGKVPPKYLADNKGMAEHRAIHWNVYQPGMTNSTYLDSILKARLRQPETARWRLSTISSESGVSLPAVERAVERLERDSDEVLAIASWAQRTPQFGPSDRYRRSLAENEALVPVDRYDPNHLAIIQQTPRTSQLDIDSHRGLDSPTVMAIRFELRPKRFGKNKGRRIANQEGFSRTGARCDQECSQGDRKQSRR